MFTTGAKAGWLAALVAATAGLVAGCSPKSPSSANSLSIGVVTDVGTVDDRSFNQLAWEGAQQGAAAVGGEASYIESGATSDYAPNINTYVERDVDVIITVGFALGDVTTAAAKNHPHITFIGVDQDQVEVLPNLAGLIIPADHSGFLAGALAGMLTGSNTVAAVLGPETIPPVVAFKQGWEQGARYTNPQVTTMAAYHTGAPSLAFNDPAWGATTARQFLDAGADVVFAAAGNTGNSALAVVAQQEGAYCIGVDADQWHTLPEARPCLVTSALRLIGPGVSDLLTAVHNDSFSGGNTTGSVGLAPFHDFDAVVSEEMRHTLETIQMGLKDGSITIADAPP